MTPRQAKLALLSFAIFAAGVAFNALVLQRKPTGAAEAAADKASAPADRGHKGHEPSSPGRGTLRTSEIARGESPLRIARFAPDSAQIDAMPEAAEDAADSTTISAIQRELKQRNYGPLPVDGLLRPGTRAAIMAFEFDRGLPLTGEAGAETLKRILLGAPASGNAPRTGRTGSMPAQEILRNVQKSLVALGYQSGAVDGQLSEDTSKAIRDFEMDKGLVPKGRVSAELLARLSEAVASAKH